MVADSQSSSLYKLRVMKGDRTGQWLWMMNVSKGNAPFQVTDWAGVERQASQYTFHPQFVSDENGAFRAINLDVAQIFQRILKTQNIDTEIVPTSPSQ